MTDALLRLDHVQLRRGSRTVLADVSFAVAPGEIVAILGQSGSGKTTVLRAIAALEPFDSGTIAIDRITLTGGRTVDARTRRALGRTVGLVFQFHCLFEHLSALDNVCLAPVHAHGVPVDEAKRRARDLFEAFGVSHRADALPRQLSGGEAQRVAIARALAVDPPLLLMDEPTASLDPARRTELVDLLRRLVARGRTLVIATHDEAFVRGAATRVLRLEGGIVHEG